MNTLELNNTPRPLSTRPTRREIGAQTGQNGPLGYSVRRLSACVLRGNACVRFQVSEEGEPPVLGVLRECVTCVWLGPPGALMTKHTETMVLVKRVGWPLRPSS